MHNGLEFSCIALRKFSNDTVISSIAMCNIIVVVAVALA